VRIFAQKNPGTFIYESVKKSPSYNVGGRVYNRTTKKGNPMINFDNVINEDAIAKLTDEQAEALLAILEKAGY
jgi:regulator of RNase E activity RraB